MFRLFRKTTGRVPRRASHRPGNMQKSLFREAWRLDCREHARSLRIIFFPRNQAVLLELAELRQTRSWAVGCPLGAARGTALSDPGQRQVAAAGARPLLQLRSCCAFRESLKCRPVRLRLIARRNRPALPNARLLSGEAGWGDVAA